MRAHSRVPTVSGVQLELPDGRLLTCKLENLSANGALISAAGKEAIELSPGARIRLGIPLSGRVQLSLEAEVVRHQAEEGAAPALGVTFPNPPPSLEQAIGAAFEEALRRVTSQIVGNVRAELLKQGITDLEKVADEVQRAKDVQSARQLFSADHYSETGADATTTIHAGEAQPGKECILWSVNLYLGLNRHPNVVARSIEALETFGTGSGSSAPSGGMSSLHKDVERRFANLLGKERALLFPTGYAANLGAMSTLPGPDDLIIFDRESHASIIDGCKLSGRRWITFKHNDVEDLAVRLEMAAGRHANIFVVLESAYSMSGDLAPLKEVVALKAKYRFYLFVDEAHSFGFYGPGGRGYCADQGVLDQVDFWMTTLSKSTAAVGGIIAAREKLCTLLQATARPYIFQATMAPSTAATVLAALDEIEFNPAHAQRLHQNAAYMRAQLLENGFDLGTSQSPIIPIYVPQVERLYELNTRLHRDNIYTVVVLYPAVEPDRGRLRFIVTASHTRAQIDHTVARLSQHARDLLIL